MKRRVNLFIAAMASLSIIVVFVSISVRASSSTPRVNLTGSWSGAYAYPRPDIPPVNFNVTMSMEGEWLTGTIIEPNTFGKKTSERLYADIRGAVMEDGRVVFLKKYNGTADVSHFVLYEGRLDETKRNIQGRWNVRSDWGGTFFMSKQ